MSCKWYDVPCWLGWLRDELKALLLWWYDSLLGGLASLLEAIPVPDFFAQISTIQVPDGVAFFASAFQLPFGVGLVVGAYTARFILRRIPFIG